ncbi:MAG: hypothetical protein ACYS4W_09255 [Planctomycetota bacterium]
MTRQLAHPATTLPATSFGRLPLTIYQLPITTHHLPFTSYQLPITIYQSPITIHQLPFTTHHLPITIHQSPFTSYQLPFNQYMQNKPNLPDAQINVSSFTTMNYEQTTMNNANKNKPNQSQFFARQGHPKPKQTQFRRRTNAAPVGD